MRNEVYDRYCTCGTVISRRRASRSGLCVECQKERRSKELRDRRKAEKVAVKPVSHFTPT